ncbi:low temperature requirement protein A [Plantactinospora soyae]|uniref:Low temperature requirement protein LtrA n=1 Tax=Plantactinospora soyae TaxID=1544732 RepID=A0A927R725_9ACTN|nr:low temperature requirement protein A [Plantactinospora soyae]MBE1487456.1 low temperature requirement protein LtrA [Plantactinospora soyae]
MATGGDAGNPAPAQPDPSRPNYLELFFDLAYIFALITLSKKALHDLTWVGLAQTLVLLLAFTLIWALSAWVGDRLDLNQPSVAPLVLGIMAGSLLMAGVVPEAYGDRGLLFAVAYLSIHFGAGVYSVLFIRGPGVSLRSGRTLLWESVAALAWITGALLATGGARAAFWAVGLVVEYLGVVLGWPAPWSRRRLPQAPRPVGERISERYRQFVIIALGASIFLVGSSFSEGPYTTARSGALVVVFMITVLIWRIYIYRAGELMTGTISTSGNPERLSQIAAFVHVVLVAGILGTAVGVQLVIRRPFGDTPTSWAVAILGGPAVFLIGRALLDYTVFAHVNRARLIGLLLLAGLAAATSLLPPIMMALAVVGILAYIATSNLIQTLLQPPTPVTR